MCHISVVSPVYGCKECLYELYYRLKETLEKITYDFEIILVNDASPDGSWELIVELSEKDPRVKGINLSRNFGQHIAITAGLDFVSGKWVVVMDCDLQDQPEEILRLYKKVIEGYDLVFGRRINRKDNYKIKILSSVFYKIFDTLTDSNSDNKTSNFGIFSKGIIDNYKLFREKSRLFPLLIGSQGYNAQFIDIEHSSRKIGRSSYTLKKKYQLAIETFISQSNKPLSFSIRIGFIMAFLSLLYLIILIIRKLSLDIPLGWTSLMVMITFIGGLILLNLGILGIYIGKIYTEVKDRPLYIIKSKTRLSSKV